MRRPGPLAEARLAYARFARITSACFSGAFVAAACFAAGLCSCARAPVVAPPPEVSPRTVLEANFSVKVHEVVESAEEDTVSFVRVYVDGQAVGQTQAGPRSSEREWQTVLPAGNRLVRFEHWAVGESGNPEHLDPDTQPQERFIRVEDGELTVVDLKFYDKSRKHSLRISRRPL